MATEAQTYLAHQEVAMNPESLPQEERGEFSNNDPDLIEDQIKKNPQRFPFGEAGLVDSYRKVKAHILFRFRSRRVRNTLPAYSGIGGVLDSFTTTRRLAAGRAASIADAEVAAGVCDDVVVAAVIPRGGGLIGQHVAVQQRGPASSVCAGGTRGEEIDMSAYDGLPTAMHDSLVDCNWSAFRCKRGP